MRALATLFFASILAMPLQAQRACAPETVPIDSAWLAWSAKTLVEGDTNLMLAGGFDVVGDSAAIPPLPLKLSRDESLCRHVLAEAQRFLPWYRGPLGPVQVLSAREYAFSARAGNGQVEMLLDSYRNMYQASSSIRPDSDPPPPLVVGDDGTRRLISRMGLYNRFDLSRMPDAGYLTVYRDGVPYSYHAFVLEVVSEPDTGYGHPCARRTTYRHLIAWRGQDTLPEGLIVQGIDFSAPLGPYRLCNENDPPAEWRPGPSLMLSPARWTDTTWGAISGSASVSTGVPGRPCRAMSPRYHWQLDFERRARCSETEHFVEFDSRAVPIGVARMVPTGPWVPIDTRVQSVRAPRQRLPGRRWTVRCDDPTLAGRESRWQCGEPRPWMFESLRRERVDPSEAPWPSSPVPPLIRVIGVVRDRETRAPVRGLVVLWESGATARTDFAGRFIGPRLYPDHGSFTVLCPTHTWWYADTLATATIPGGGMGLVAREVLVDPRRCTEPPAAAVTATIEGHYSGSLEESRFVPCPGSLDRVWPRRVRDIWVPWFPSSPDSTVRRWPKPDTSGAAPRWFVRLRGRLYGPGTYGRLGIADHQLKVTRVLEVRTPSAADCRES